MSHEPISYTDAVRIFSDGDVQADLDDACKKLAQSTVDIMQAFDSVATQLHTVDLHGLAAPTLPKWNLIRKVTNILQYFVAYVADIGPTRTLETSSGNHVPMQDLSPVVSKVSRMLLLLIESLNH